jgi:hypothetical protein
VEAAFKNLKDDLQLRPIYHQLIGRIEAHIFVALLAYCLHVTLRARLRPLASGLAKLREALRMCCKGVCPVSRAERQLGHAIPSGRREPQPGHYR